MKGSDKIQEGISLLKKIQEKLNIPRVHNMDEAIKLFSSGNDCVMCVNGKKTMVAKTIVDCEKFYIK